MTDAATVGHLAPDRTEFNGSTAIVGGTLVTPRGRMRADVLIEDGKVAALGRAGGWNADRSIDVSGHYVLPGVVDPEAHLGVLKPFEEDVAAESHAAVATGVTTWGIQQVVVNTAPEHLPEVTAEDHVPWSERLPWAIDAIGRSASNDVYLTAVLMTDKQVDEVPRLATEFGVTSFKMYMHLQAGPEKLGPKWYAGHRVHAFDDGTVYRAMRAIAGLGYPGILSVHCENWDIGWALEDELRAAGRNDMAAWDAKSPAFVEAGHVRHYAYYAGVTGCPLHIQHVTTPETVEEIEKARREGVTIYGQTGHHYLVLDRSAWKINVPLRSEQTREWMWQALRDGQIDAIGSDHVAQDKTREEMLGETVWDTLSGFPSRVETLLPALLSEGVAQGRFSLEDVVRVACEHPARLWGLYPRKGALEVGSDGDVCVVDLDREVEVQRSNIVSPAPWSIFEGWRFKGWPVATILRGQVKAVWPQGQDRAELAPQGGGRYVPRPAPSAPYRAAPARVIR